MLANIRIGNILDWMKMKKIVIPVLIIAVLLIVAIKVVSAEKPVPVNTVPVKKGDVDRIVSSTSSGSVEPAEKANLMSEYPGAVTRINYKKGDHVKKGDIIIVMDNAIAKVELDSTEEAYSRAKRLFPSRAISKASLDTAMYAYRGALARYEQSFIRTPLSGVITELNVHLGEFPLGGNSMLPGATSSLQQYGLLVQVVDDGSYHIKAPFDEVDSGMIKTGQQAHITFDAFPDRVFEGRVIEVSPAVSTALDLNRTIEAQISLPHISGIKMGMSADVEIIVSVAKDVLYVPTYTIQDSSATNKFVWVVRNGRAAKTDVQTGISNWDSTVITKGLTQDMKVILPSDKYTLREGMKVSAHD